MQTPSWNGCIRINTIWFVRLVPRGNALCAGEKLFKSIYQYDYEGGKADSCMQNAWNGHVTIGPKHAEMIN